MPRPETGLMRFGEDWTGVFIRGDAAKFYAVALGELIARTTRHLEDAPKTVTEQVMLGALQGLRRLLESSDHFSKEYDKEFQLGQVQRLCRWRFQKGQHDEADRSSDAG